MAKAQQKKPEKTQKKPKESGVMKATTKKKPQHKKWTKGKAKQKADHAVFLNKQNYEKLMETIPKLGKHISASLIVQKFKVVGSVARILLRRLAASGAIKATETHSKQGLFTQVIVPVDPAVAAAEAKDAGKDQGKGKEQGKGKKDASKKQPGSQKPKAQKGQKNQKAQKVEQQK